MNTTVGYQIRSTKLKDEMEKVLQRSTRVSSFSFTAGGEKKKAAQVAAKPKKVAAAKK